MQLLKITPKVRLTPAETFAAHYDWLLRWALSFVNEDRAAAEDLVQETFLRFVLQQTELDDPKAAKPLLYTYLKHSHLSGLRQAQRHPFLIFSVAEFDTLQMGLRQQNGADPIEVQDTLRLIVGYLSWRKQTSKSASILILRFFHGYFPEEIMKISLLSRQSVDFGINAAREEVQSYLNDPASLHIMHHEPLPEVHLSHTAKEPDRLIEELQQTLLQNRGSSCLKREQLLRYYITDEPKPIPTELLAHLVSCRDCLDVISRHHNMPTLSGRCPQEALGFAKRPGRSSKRANSATYGLHQTLRMAAHRFREVVEHKPKVLMILMNGEVIASQQIQSSVNKQTIPIRACVASDFIEVVTEQNVCFVSMAIDSVPPNSATHLMQHVDLSDKRTIDVVLSFTSSGCVVEVSYLDPLYLESSSAANQAVYERELGSEAWEDGAQLGYLDSPSSAPIRIEDGRSLPLLEVLRQYLFRPKPAAFASGLLATVVLVISLTVWHEQHWRITPSELLQRAQVATEAATKPRDGVLRQTVRIDTPKLSIHRTIYHDLQGKRHAHEPPAGEPEAQIQEQLTTAGVLWNDPLSASSYKEWHDRQRGSTDEIEQTADGRMTLTTTVPNGPVSEESLTLRETDFHTVERKVTFRDSGLVEIAEVSYDVLPWNSVPRDAFDTASSAPLVLGSPFTRATSSLPYVPASLTPEQLDDADLEARLVLTRLNAYTSERIELVRQPNGIEVTGIVSTSARKREIEFKLKMVPHVIPYFLTFQEMQSKQQSLESSSDPSLALREKTETAEPSVLTKFLSAQGGGDDRISALAQQLTGSSFDVSRHSKAIAELIRKYGDGEHLSADGKGALRMLVSDQTMKLFIALDKEQNLLDEIYPQPHSIEPLHHSTSMDISAIGEDNVQLCTKLTSSQDQPVQSVPAFVTEIEANIATLRQAVEHTPVVGLYPDRSLPDSQATSNTHP